MTIENKQSGQCQCGAVKFETTGKLRPVVACHCRECRRLTGNFMAATATLLKDFKLLNNQSLKWFRSSNKAQRGFCNQCGANLFWQHDDYPTISITAGCMDDDSYLEFWGHIYTGEKGRYYTIDANDIQFEVHAQDYPILAE